MSGFWHTDFSIRPEYSSVEVFDQDEADHIAAEEHDIESDIPADWEHHA
jgi:hypothetical protein